MIKMDEFYKDQKARLIAMVSREEMDFIDRIGKDALYSTGRKLTRAEVVSAILDAIASLPITGKGIRSEEVFREYILKAIESARTR